MKDALDLASKSGIHRLHHSAWKNAASFVAFPTGPAALEVVKLPQQATMAAPPKGRAPFKPQVVDGGAAQPLAANDTRDLPVLGKIAAGTPLEAIQQERDRLPVPACMRGAGVPFGLEIQGDSDDQRRHPRRRLRGDQAAATPPPPAISSWLW